MLVLLIGLQILVLSGMVAVSVWGRGRMPTDSRVRVRAGPTGIDWTISKKTTLLMTPIIGTLIVLSTWALKDSPTRIAIASSGLAVMVIFYLAHQSAVRRASR